MRQIETLCKNEKIESDSSGLQCKMLSRFISPDFWQWERMAWTRNKELTIFLGTWIMKVENKRYLLNEDFFVSD